MSSRPILNLNSKYSNPINTVTTSRKNSPYQNEQVHHWRSSSEKVDRYQIQVENSSSQEQDEANGEDSYSENKKYTSLRDISH